jgi:hypothetical protein
VTVTILLLVWYLSIPDEWRVRFVSLGHTKDPNSTWWTLIAIPHYTNVPFNLDIDPHGQFFNVPGDLLNRQEGTPTFALTIQRIEIFGGLPFIYVLFVDFGALIATRRVFQHISTATVWRVIITFVVYACGILVLSFIALDIAVLILNYAFIGSVPSRSEELIFSLSQFARGILPFYTSHPREWQIDTLYGVFIWSTLMGILWLAIFSASVIIANVSMKLSGVGPWLDRNFQVRRQPLRILRALVIIVLSGVCAIYHLLFL